MRSVWVHGKVLLGIVEHLNGHYDWIVMFGQGTSSLLDIYERMPKFSLEGDYKYVVNSYSGRITCARKCFTFSREIVATYIFVDHVLFHLSLLTDSSSC